ncbi:hypothetical protein DVA86_27115 [Streptomyces armeniacus]|uniref:Thioredoxin domain-containing protein n=1 Tax=Streptomyces armeniacus TaxID=83291 RepID=A0A345XVU1_9ACTN|nr:hypothetical protein [Streptomyces armeniacus]AXK35757.1 hypothetical protein DVA86_27115 [Streptomyces armeniacus]
MDFVTSALLASWVAIALLAFVVAGLVRQVHQLSRAGTGTRGAPPRRAGIEPGRPAPAIGEILGPDGGSDRDPGNRDALLLFLSDTCQTCEDVLSAASDWIRREGGDQGPAIRAVYAEPSVAVTDSRVPILAGRLDLFDVYDAIATPYAVLVDATGRVARSEPVGSASALLELLNSDVPGQVRSS